MEGILGGLGCHKPFSLTQLVRYHQHQIMPAVQEILAICLVFARDCRLFAR